jgi:hypothetical protein
MSGMPSCAAAAAGLQTTASMMLYRMNFTIVSPELLLGGPNLQVRPKRADLKVRPSIRMVVRARQREETIKF